MRYFPQLLTGAMSQYPLIRRRGLRTAMNECHDGGSVKLADPDHSHVIWELPLSGLADREWSAIEAFFTECEGCLRTFTFLDPAGNLFSSSEDLMSGYWQKDPLLLIGGGVEDPWGTERGTRLTNIGQMKQGIWQSLAVPAVFHYSFSLYARSPQATDVTLRSFSASTSVYNRVGVSPNWRPVWTSGQLGGSEEEVAFGLEVEAGDQVEVFGLQAEPQAGRSDYKRTVLGGGIYANSRFLDDSLTVTTHGRDNHSTVIRIISRPGA